MTARSHAHGVERLLWPLRRRRVPHLRTTGLGLAAGILLGLGVTSAGVALRGVASPEAVASDGVIDATHVPPTLVGPTERVALRYDINCAPPAEVDSSGCAGSGTVYLRAGQSGAFSPLALTLDEDAPEGRYSVLVPAAIASSPAGFSYYAVLRDESSGATLTLPPGGSAAPQQALPFVSPVAVDLGAVDFASTAAPAAEVARARWGDGPTDVGLEDARGPRMGAASFAVSPAGDVALLDEAHRRVLRWSPGASAPTVLPVAISPTQADIGLGGDGSLYLLESPHAGSPKPRLRAFDRKGTALASTILEERTAAALEVSGGSAFTLSYPGGRWLPTMSDVGSGQPRALQADARRSQASVGRPASGGRQVVLVRMGEETRLALASARGVVRSWRLTSSADLGEIQLAKPFGNGIVVVAHPSTEERDQFLVLLLGPRGLARRFGVASNGWAETAPLSRFRLAGSSLYQLGSDETGAFVQRFDLGGIS